MFKTISTRLVNLMNPNLELYFQDNNGAFVQELSVFNPDRKKLNVNLVLINTSPKVAEFIKVEIDFQRKLEHRVFNEAALSMGMDISHQYWNYWKTNIFTSLHHYDCKPCFMVDAISSYMGMTRKA